MAIHPDPSFPLLRQDQTDVIRIFLELMREGDRSGRTPEVIGRQPYSPKNDLNRPKTLGELLDFD